MLLVLTVRGLPVDCCTRLGEALKNENYLLIALVAIAWLGNALYALGAPGGSLKFFSPGLVAFAMIWYVFQHGARRYGRKLFLKFILTVFAVGWSFETVSIVTGVPFGNYHYTELMAPFLGHVPVFVLPAYGVMGYICWSLATLIIGQRAVLLDRAGLVFVPLLGALLMMLWDLSMDPLRATVEGRWVWVEGGSHMGVPWLNYLGWFVVTWLMFQLFALLVQREGRQNETPQSRLWWFSVPCMYLAFAVEYILNPITGQAAEAQVFWSGQVFIVSDIYRDVSLLTLFTMLPMAFLGALCVWHPLLINRFVLSCLGGLKRRGPHEKQY